MTRIVIFGAGSIGCYVGLSWLSGGLDVRFLGRQATADALANDDAVLASEAGEIIVARNRITVSTTPACLAAADIIVLSVKTVADETACREIAAHARPGTLVLSLQNGVDNAARLTPLLPAMTVVEGMVPFNVVRPAPTRFEKASAGGVMAGHNPKLEAALTPLSGGPHAVAFCADMRAVKWSKLLLNLNNPLNALSGKTLYEELSEIGWRRLLAAMQRECLEVMAAEDIDPAKLGPLPPRLIPPFLCLPDWLFNRTGLKLQKITHGARSSMADDFAAGRRTEIDFLNGEVSARGRRHGVPCPVCETVAALVRDAECGGRKVWTANEIAAAVNRRSAGAAS